MRAFSFSPAMNKPAIITTLALAAFPAAACTTADSWTGPDKNKHVLAGVAIGSAGTLVFKDPHKGFLLGAAVGVAKEIYDRKHGGTCSLQDGVMTALGAAAGAYGTAWIIAPRKNGVFVGFSKAL